MTLSLPDRKPLITALSLGWGVQSLTLAAMSALDYLPKLDAAIHADTGHENPETYAIAERLTPWLAGHGVKVITVQPENNDPVQPSWGSGSIQIPAFTTSRTSQATGQVKRQCTRHWKITPIRAAIRQLSGGKRLPANAVEQWQGISLDEAHRMRTSDVKYINNRYPLVELRLSRADCIQWLQDHGLPVPDKSACVFCPYQSMNHWREMKRRGGDAWRKIVETDLAIREVEKANTVYLHPARVPVTTAVSIPEDQGAFQPELDLPCDSGHCFV